MHFEVAFGAPQSGHGSSRSFMTGIFGPLGSCFRLSVLALYAGSSVGRRARCSKARGGKCLGVGTHRNEPASTRLVRTRLVFSGVASWRMENS